MINEEKEIIESGCLWVRKNQHELISRFADPKDFGRDIYPTTIFMAGSPGAGKTEISKRFIEVKKAVRIDADEIRGLCPGYNGLNSHLFQKAASRGVDILFDYIIKNKINAVIDGTFAHSKVLENIERSLKHNRTTEIVFVYQDPFQAWDFTKKREKLENRKITKDRFIESFFDSQKNTRLVKDKFGNKVELTVIIKDLQNDTQEMRLNVNNLDSCIKNNYTQEDLTSLLP